MSESRDIPPPVVAAWGRLAPPGGRILLAASGGPDSTALVVSAAALFPAERLHVISVDHRTRPDSADDARHAVELAHGMSLSAEVVTLAREAGPLSEEEARKGRYAALAEAAARNSAVAVATGHQADDQAETILFRILRGTGLDGLAGIPASRPITTPAGEIELLRPLLEVTRAELIDMLDERGIAYRQDPSNRDPAYRRNRLRHEVLPLLREVAGPGVDAALRRLGLLAEEEQEAVSAETTRMRRLIANDARSEQDEIRVIWPIEPLDAIPAARLRSLFVALWIERGWPRQGMTRRSWLDVAKVARGDETAIDLPGGVTARRSDGRLTLSGPPRHTSSCVDSGPTAD